MDRRVALGALWALFAAASVGVGFGAAGLVGDPFTDPADVSTGSVVSSTGSATGSPAPTGSATGSPSGSPSSSHSGDPTSSPSSREPSTSSPSGGPSSSRPSASRSPGPTTEVRGISTRGGYVSASCRDGLVAVSASPAVGWAIDDVDSGRAENAGVRFEGSDDSDQRVEVRATCVGGVPRFAVEDRDRGSGDGDDGGSGGGDGGGGSGSSGSGSSGSGGGDD